MKLRNKIIILLILSILTMILSAYIGNKSSKVNEETKDNNIARYKHEGTYGNITYDFILNDNDKKTNNINDLYYVIIRDEEYINIYKCSDDTGCLVYFDNLKCNDEYTKCSKEINSNFENTMVELTFSDNTLELKENSSFVDGSSAIFTFFAEFKNNSIEIKEYVPRKNTKIPPMIGMTSEEVRKSTWGNPKKINKTTYSWGTTEQWVYEGNKYIYFRNGLVEAISE